MINVIDQKTEIITDSMDISIYDGINRLMENFIAHIQGKIFINEGLVFVSSKELDFINEAQDQYNLLVIVKDIFVCHDLFSSKE